MIKFTPQISFLVMVIFLMPALVSAQGFSRDPCDCLDLLFIVDDSGDMEDVVANLQAAFAPTIWPVAESICSDVRFGVISFKDDVTADLPFNPSGYACQNALENIVVDGGGSVPEASDQALLEAFDVEGSLCTVPPGFDPNTWRPECCKIAVLLTNAPPAGCDDSASPGDLDNGLAQSILASSMDIMIVAVYETLPGRDPEVADLMARYAGNTTGLYAESVHGTGLGSFIVEGIMKCVQGTSETEFCCVQDENTYCVETFVGLCGSLGGDITADCGLCLMSGGNPSTTPNSVLALHQCAPNPFNPRTTIAFDLPRRASVNLRVFDLAARLVKELLSGEEHPPGRHEVLWNGRDDNGRQVASGTYFYRLEAGSFSETKRMVLLK